MTAYTEEEIKQWTAYWHGQVLYSRSSEEKHYPEAETILQLIYTWAVAKAEAERVSHILYMHNGCEPESEDECDYFNHDWVGDLLSRIGWPQDGGQER